MANDSAWFHLASSFCALSKSADCHGNRSLRCFQVLEPCSCFQYFFFFFVCFHRVEGHLQQISRPCTNTALPLKPPSEKLWHWTCRGRGVFGLCVCVCVLTCKAAYVHCGNLPWVSWLHISRINELIWKTKSLQREADVSSLFFAYSASGGVCHGILM